MRSILITAAAAAILSASGPALAGSDDATSKGKAHASEKKVCRLLDTTGSRMAERVCLTKAEWKKVDSQAR